jgi:hypothetical protein
MYLELRFFEKYLFLHRGYITGRCRRCNHPRKGTFPYHAVKPICFKAIRFRDCFKHCGKQWDDRVETEVKTAVAQTVAAQPADAVNLHHKGSIDSLIQALERRLKEKAQQEA